MSSRWLKYKERAIVLRKRSFSIRQIEKKFGIPRSTLSGWFKKVQLTKCQQDSLFKKWQYALTKAREKASEWHRQEKQKRLQRAKREAIMVVDNLNLQDVAVLELAIAMLYFGEGTKKVLGVRMSNSNPQLLKMFITLLVWIYKIDINKIKCGINLRADQKPIAIKKFWSQQLSLPLKNFTYVFVDKRSAASKTYPDYKGVCMVRYGNVAIKRRLEAIADEFCKKVAPLA